jgi:predicted transcriptional regulator
MVVYEILKTLKNDPFANINGLLKENLGINDHSAIMKVGAFRTLAEQKGLIEITGGAWSLTPKGCELLNTMEQLEQLERLFK